jgi:hypothetical protein
MGGGAADGLFLHCQPREIQHHHRRPRGLALVFKADVHAGHPPHRAQGIFPHHLVTQAGLNVARLGNGGRPLGTLVGIVSHIGSHLAP